MESLGSVQTRPEVSVIIPARNEEACLGACLRSLLGQAGVDFEIIVVDDHSTDNTREIAQSFPGISVITPPVLVTGWTGKNNALIAGATRAKGDWLLFTDADTVHLPGSLERSIAEAKRQGAALLSYSPEQAVHRFWEKAVMPVVFAELACTYKPSQVSDPNTAAAAANGQYLLVSREAYDAVGGHAAIAHNLLEDVALARAVKRSGRMIFFRYGADMVRTRMYRSFGELREGWTKNLSLLFARPLRLAILRSAEFLFISASSAVAVRASARRHWGALLVASGTSVVLYTLFVRRVRKAHFASSSNLLAVFGLPVFSYLLWRSQLSHKRGNVVWKGRTYAGCEPLHQQDERLGAKRNAGSSDLKVAHGRSRWSI
jgi:glycosyltransferase involved in cell wall biosynthesis